MWPPAYLKPHTFTQTLSFIRSCPLISGIQFKEGLNLHRLELKPCFQSHHCRRALLYLLILLLLLLFFVPLIFLKRRDRARSLSIFLSLFLPCSTNHGLSMEVIQLICEQLRLPTQHIRWLGSPVNSAVCLVSKRKQKEKKPLPFCFLLLFIFLLPIISCSLLSI